MTTRTFAILTLGAAACALAGGGPAPIRFDDATAESGIRFTHSFGAEKLGSLLESTGAGCVWFDYNNDGKPDLFVVSGRPLGKEMHPYPLRKAPDPAPTNHLYRNDGDGRFTDVTADAGVAGDSFSFSAVAADFDNDGFTDLLVTSYGRVTLYRNMGDGTFEDVTKKAGLDVKGWAINATWLDYDRDGCVDLFIGRYVKFDPKYRSYYAADNYPGPLDYAGDTNLLYHNTCKGSFVDVSEKSGIAAHVGRAMGVTAADFDGDGYTDIYVTNDKTENLLFHNKHDGTFEEIATEAGAAFGQNGESTSAMGPVFFDPENRGAADLWVSDSRYNRLLRNTGKLEFTDTTQQSSIAQWTAQYTSWGTGAYDFDNDGWRDIFIAHGGLIHLIPQEHSLFRNLGNGKFQDVSAAAGAFFQTKTVGRGACFADYDTDGKVDAFLVNLGSAGVLLHNTTAQAGHWIKVALAGVRSNRDGIGAVVEVVAGGVKQRAERVAASGYLSQDDWRLHFGLGASTRVDRITVTWPGGMRQVLENVAAGQVVTIREKP
ncbi:MAG TPA: CRTAC1 family protein [Bryobacteraceae bacterium]|nr:CRTAC1 family protein [Bryobacteraceae bacterium]